MVAPTDPRPLHELAEFAGAGDQAAAHRQLGDAEVAPGTPATHPYGILYQGAWETLADGTGVAVRRHARALSKAGLPVLLRSFNHTFINQYGLPEPAPGMYDQVTEKIGPEVRVIDPKGQRELDRAKALVQTSIAQLAPRIYHLVIRDAEHLRAALVPRYVSYDTLDPAQALEQQQALYRSSIVMSVWERTSIDEQVARALGRCAQAWVPCRQNARALIDSGVPEAKVRVVPHPYDPAADICKLVRRRPRPGRRFYSIGAWQPRKGFHELVGAFLLAFEPSDDVRLTIKYTGGKWEDYPGPATSLKRWLCNDAVRGQGWSMEALRGKLILHEGRVSADQILKLHFENNIYVSAGHGEAWCLPAFDAVCAGNALVHVPWGGTADFDSGHGVVVPFRMGPVHPSYGWGPDAQWADYDLAELTASLRLCEAPAAHERSAEFERRFSLTAVGAQMRALVLDVARATPGAHRYLQECGHDQA